MIGSSLRKALFGDSRFGAEYANKPGFFRDGVRPRWWGRNVKIIVEHNPDSGIQVNAASRVVPRYRAWGTRFLAGVLACTLVGIPGQNFEDKTAPEAVAMLPEITGDGGSRVGGAFASVPRFGVGMATGFIRGLGVDGDTFKCLVDRTPGITVDSCEATDPGGEGAAVSTEGGTISAETSRGAVVVCATNPDGAVPSGSPQDWLDAHQNRLDKQATSAEHGNFASAAMGAAQAKGVGLQDESCHLG